MPRLPASILAGLFCAAACLPTASGQDLAAALEAVRGKHQLPALGVAAMQEGKLTHCAVVGVRIAGEAAPVAKDDLWHIGSCTKSMTATLAGVLVEAGLIRWETTIGEVLSDWRDLLRDGWEKVTLEQLLTNRSGAPHEAPADVWSLAWQRRGSELEQRMAFVRGILAKPPEAEPGTKYIYSNQGFTIAGLMLERVAKKPFEDLLREKVFAPLGMKSAGFGGPGERQPRGHRGAPGAWKAVAPDADNPPAITPAGRVHCSLADFVRYASWHARGPAHDVPLVSAATFQKLHTPPAGGDYAFGWGVHQRAWAGGAALAHTGSNTYWFAVVWVAPARQSAYVAVTNCAGPVAERACDEAVSLLLLKR
jgi:CubicO group peptidase (beta-lactamase class C family)